MERRKSYTQTERMVEYKKGHVEISPTGQKLLYCPHEGCDKVLTSSPGLRYHMRTHCGNERPYKCNRCKKTFKSANGLKYHTEKTRCELAIDFVAVRDSLKLPNDVESYLDDDIEVDVVSMTQPLDIHAARYRTRSESSYADISPTPYTASLDSQEEIINPLTQLAIIATGPQSPLLRNNQSLIDYQRASQSFNASIHSYAKPPLSNRTSPVISRKRSLSFSGPDSKYLLNSTSSGQSYSSDDESRHDGSNSNSSELDLELDHNSPSDDDNNNCDFTRSWPKVKWQCFVTGCKVRIENGRATDWKSVESDFEEKYMTGTYAPHGLQLTKILSKTSLLHLIFRPAHVDDHTRLFAQCQLDHPFFVKDKGWCSCFPSFTERNYGIQCSILDIDDICLPPNHPDALFTRNAVKSLTSLQFTPEDSTAVFTLSLMARSRRQSDSMEELSRSLPEKIQDKPGRKKPFIPFRYKSVIKAKRPMNAFMLFAKKFRLEYTQMYPGKDNRAISVLLGDRWKKMKNEERKAFSIQAKQLADQYRRQNPDCWKRKRSISESCLS